MPTEKLRLDRRMTHYQNKFWFNNGIVSKGTTNSIDSTDLTDLRDEIEGQNKRSKRGNRCRSKKQNWPKRCLRILRNKILITSHGNNLRGDQRKTLEIQIKRTLSKVVPNNSSSQSSTKCWMPTNSSSTLSSKYSPWANLTCSLAKLPETRQMSSKSSQSKTNPVKVLKTSATRRTRSSSSSSNQRSKSLWNSTWTRRIEASCW